MIRTEVDKLTWCCLLMGRWRPYSQQYLVVGSVGLALWLGSGLALYKYSLERLDNDDVKRPVGRITGALMARPAG